MSYPFSISIDGWTCRLEIKPSSADRFREDLIYWSHSPRRSRDGARGIFLGCALAEASCLPGPSVRLANRNRADRIGGRVAAGSSRSAPLQGRPRLLDAPLHLASAPHDLGSPRRPGPRYFGSTSWLFSVAPLFCLIARNRSRAFVSVIATYPQYRWRV